MTSLDLGGLVVLLVIGKTSTERWPILAQDALSAVVGGVTALSVARMGYVVWRDYDIVRLQKELIDASASEDDITAQVEASVQKLAVMQSSGLKRYVTAPPTNWDD